MAARLRPWFTRWTIGGLLLVVAVAIATTRGLRVAAIGAPVAASTLIPEDAPAYAYCASLGALADDLRQLGAQLEGSGGLSEAAGVALGLPQLDREALTAVGLRPDVGIAAFASAGELWLALPSITQAGVVHIRRTLERRGLGLVEAAPRHFRNADANIDLRWLEDGALILRTPLPAAWANALGMVGAARGGPAGAAANGTAASGATANGEAANGAAGGVAGAEPMRLRPFDEAIAAWQQSKRLPARVATGLHAEVRLGANDALRPRLRAAIGPASLLFGRAVDAVAGARRDGDGLSAAPHVRLTLQLPAGLGRELGAYHQDFLAGGQAVDLGALLPDEVALLLRGRVNPALLDMVPAMLRDRLLPKELLGRLDPALAAVDARALLIEALDGQLFGGLLGVDDSVALGPKLNADLASQLPAVGAFVGVGLRSAEARAALQRAIEAALAAAGRAGSPVTLGAFTGHSYAGSQPHESPETTLLGGGRALLVLVGAGEHERWQRVAAGKMPSAASAAASAQERAVLQGQGTWWAASSTLGRVVRAARRRGVPEHFVRMIASVAAVSAGLKLGEEGLTFELVLRPRGDGAAP